MGSAGFITGATMGANGLTTGANGFSAGAWEAIIVGAAGFTEETIAGAYGAIGDGWCG